MPGRCAGCGKTGSACKVNGHLPDCGKWLALALSDPEKALDAEAEYERWKTEDKDAEREQRRETLSVQGDRARAASLGRFQYVDILAED